MWNWNFLRKLNRGRSRQTLSAVAYDPSIRTSENAWLFSGTNNYAADVDLNHEKRADVRNRARKTVRNAPFARKLVNNYANNVIGMGIRLQMLTDDEDLNREVEDSFTEWADEVQLAEKLRLMTMAKVQDGETFAILYTNPKLKHRVQLDLQIFECDRVRSLDCRMDDPQNIDGVHIDRFGNPISYDICKTHPGGYVFDMEMQSFEAKHVVHWFKRDRPEQHRGVSEIMAGLDLFDMLADMNRATLIAAINAAKLSALIKTDLPASGMAADIPDGFRMPLYAGTAAGIPGGWDVCQLKPEQPTSRHAEFVRSVLTEIGCCCMMPVHILMGDSSQHNYASMRGDLQDFQMFIKTVQKSLVDVVVKKFSDIWMDLYGLPEQPERDWFFDAREHVDPLKNASAQKMLMELGLTNKAIEYAKMRRNWRNEVDEILDEELYEREGRLKRGLPLYTDPSTPQSEQETTDLDLDAMQVNVSTAQNARNYSFWR